MEKRERNYSLLTRSLVLLQPKVAKFPILFFFMNIAVLDFILTASVYHNAAEVFADTQPLIRSVLDGFNVCIFAYGQTGSGKTHTMVRQLLIFELFNHRSGYHLVKRKGKNIMLIVPKFFYLQTGPSDLTKETLGVNYRALSDLFLISEQRRDVISYDISVQMVEIYNEQVRDLLTPDGVNKKYPFCNHSFLCLSILLLALYLFGLLNV